MKNNKIRNTIKNTALMLLGGIIFGGVAVYAETLLSSNQVIYDNSNSDAQSDTVQGALDELYEKHTVLSNLNNTFAPTIVTEGDGLYKSITDKNRYIYRGTNPNNYIWLDENGDNNQTDEELYRIIAFEADGTIKVIRNQVLSEKKSWDTNIDQTRHNETNTYCNYTSEYNGCNVWGNLSNTYYNGQLLGNEFYYQYFESANSTMLKKGNYSGAVKENASLNTYLNNQWLSDEKYSNLNNFIDAHEFYVGGLYYSSTYTGGDKGIYKEKKEEQSYIWKDENSKIGLINVTEYVESSTDVSCTSVYSHYLHNTNSQYPCNNENWLKLNVDWTTINALGVNQRSVWYINPSRISTDNSSINANIRPVFYLKSSIKLTGLGTIDNPYKIL